MSNIEIKHLYHYSRFPESSSKIGLLILYIPIGVILVLLRTILALILYLLSFLLPNALAFHSIFHKLMYVTFGIVINIENIDKKEDVDAFISNKGSLFDSIVVNSFTKCVTPGIKLNGFLSSTFGIQYFASVNNLEELKKDLMNIIYENKVPVYFQPESIITNGKALLKFSVWPFTICNKVQPIAIAISRPGLEISISTIDSSYWSDLFYFMFVPCTVYKIKFLSPIEKKGLSEESFINKVRQNIAAELKVELSNYSASDLREYVKRYNIEQQRNFTTERSTTGDVVNPEIHRMSMQVREVLPLVPYDVIYKDLAKTRSVDITITNILEGHVPYVVEQSKPSLSSTSTSTSAKSSTSSVNVGTTSQISNSSLITAASVFGKSPQERNLSFQDRKRLLIENSRKRYIEKHGLNILGS